MPLSSKIINYYKLDGNSNDAIGGFNGIDTNINYSNSYGKINQGAQFGANSRIAKTANTLVKLSNYSLSFWIYPTTTTNNSGLITDNGAGFGIWYFYINKTVGFNGANNPSATNSVPFNTWSFVVFNNEMGTGQFYVNGIASGASFTSGGNITFNSISQNTLAAFYFYGNLDEIGIYNNVLTLNEITTLYNNGLGNQYPFIESESNFLTMF